MLSTTTVYLHKLMLQFFDFRFEFELFAFGRSIESYIQLNRDSTWSDSIRSDLTVCELLSRFSGPPQLREITPRSYQIVSGDWFEYEPLVFVEGDDSARLELRTTPAREGVKSIRIVNHRIQLHPDTEPPNT